VSAFVTDGFWRKSVAAVRALGHAGIDVHAGESTRCAPALWSKHATGTCVYPSPRTQPERFIAALAGELEARRCTVLMVPEEETLSLVLREQASLPPQVRIIGAPQAGFERARDKAQALAAADALAQTALAWCRPADDGTLPSEALNLPFPVVVKPRVGSGARGLRYVDDLDALPEVVRTVTASHGPVVVQEAMPPGGTGLGASLFIDDAGTIRAAFCHKRIREYPVRGGAATCAESIHAPGLVKEAARLCRHLGVHGFVMVEFRRDPRDRLIKLLEINPRLWGSLALAEACGVNFPAIAYRACMGEAAGPPPAYEAGVRMRFLVPGDLLHFLRHPKRMQIEPPWWSSHKQARWWDEWEPGDAGPAFGRIASLLPLLTSREWRSFL
jgi:predicted ATP-grasp superfamily ATP-dependent carboligase